MQIFAICYGWAQISGTVSPKESSGSSGGSRGAEPRSRWPKKGCVTGVVVVIIIVLVTASAYVAEVVPGHVVAVTAVVAGAAPPAALIVVLPIVGRMCAAADAAAVYDVEHSTTRVGAIR